MSMLSRVRGERSGRLAAALAVALALAACSTSPRPSGSAGSSLEPTQSAGTCSSLSAPSLAPRLAWSARATFYELFVRSFADSNGDGIGDLRGLTEHLDYLNDGDPSTTDDLGVTGLWLMPVAESPSYHGYDVTDYTAIESDYGTLADFRAFIEAAHDREMLVLVDLVMNHTSRDHPWFQDAQTPGSEHDDWYVWSDTDPGWPPVAGPSPWHPNGERFYYGAFWEGMPDLNLRSEAVTAELQRIAHVWIDDYGVDGFRLDAAKHLIEDGPDAQVNTPETHAWLQAFTTAIGDPAIDVGEVWDSRATTVSYVADGSLDFVFDFGIGPTIESAVRLGDANSLEVNQAELMDRYPVGSVATFLTNHDQPRVMTDLNREPELAKQAASVLLTGPGLPFLYYGEELGMIGTKPDEQIRTPLPWTGERPGFGFTTGTPWESFAVGAETANVATESADEASLLSTYRRLTRVRAEHPALAWGSVTRLKSSALGVSAVVRSLQGGEAEDLLVVSNLTGEAQRDVSFSVDSAPLCPGAVPSGELVFSSDPTISGPALAPTILPNGALEAWTPVPLLPAHSTLVFDLSP